jgi:hypothetical protein
VYVVYNSFQKESELSDSVLKSEIWLLVFGFWFGFALLLLGFSVEREREREESTS